MILVAILNWMAERAKLEVDQRLAEIRKGNADEKTNAANVEKYNVAIGRVARATAALDLINRTPPSPK